MMALPTSYLTTSKKLSEILDAIKSAQAPKVFTLNFLESLGYTSSSDRLLVPVLKALGFLDPKGSPTQRYFEFLDQTRSAGVLAEGIREAYADLFQINKNAQDMSPAELQNKFKTLSQGKLSDDVLKKMATTFKALAGMADFSASPKSVGPTPLPATPPAEPKQSEPELSAKGLKIGGLVYNIQLVLPESRDQAVYDALFKSLRDHLL
jgi:hypothetical protein